MKKYLVIVLLLAVFTTKAQDKAVYDNVVSNVTKAFNAADYTLVYEMLSPDFKTKVNEKDFTAFLTRTAAMGKITASEYSGEKDGFKTYKTTFEKGILSMLIACNAQSQIEGFALRPFTAKAVRTTPVATDNVKSTALDKEVDKAVTEFMADPETVGAVVALVKDGNVSYYHYGEPKKQTQQLPSNSTIFEIGSISKTFTGILLAQAVLDKKIKLDDDIRKYLPAKCAGLQFNGTPILVKQLSNHTSGLPRLQDDLESTPGYDAKDPYKHYTKEMYYSYLARVKLQSLPGTKQDYSNMGVAILGLILEKVYSKSYLELLKKYITDPLKMSNTYIDLPNNQLPYFATGYSSGVETSHWNLNNASPAGGIRSTIADISIISKSQYQRSITSYRFIT